MDSPLYLLVFESIFIIIGGIALGWVLRKLLAHQFSALVVFFIIWGSMFGLVPLVGSAGTFEAMHAGYLVIVQILTLLAAVAFTAFTPQEYLSAFASLPIALITFGGFILVLDAIILSDLVRQDLQTALIVGSVFTFVGGSLFVIGVIMAVRDR